MFKLYSHITWGLLHRIYLNGNKLLYFFYFKSFSLIFSALVATPLSKHMIRQDHVTVLNVYFVIIVH